MLTVSPVEHHGSSDSARAVVDPYLRAWEIRHALWAGKPEFRFEFDHAELVDRDPPPEEPGGPRRAHIVTVGTAVETDAALSLHVGRASYPTPPTNFAVDVDVETLWHRWTGYRAGREPLQSMAYFCLTVLEMHGGRDGAAQRFSISLRVLRKLAELTSNRGDVASARKARAAATPLTGPEQAWLEKAVMKMIVRVGEVAADPTSQRPILTLADLPSLSGT